MKNTSTTASDLERLGRKFTHAILSLLVFSLLPVAIYAHNPEMSFPEKMLHQLKDSIQEVFEKEAFITLWLQFTMMEICDNELDDDGDGLVDCFDPDCFSCTGFYFGQPTPTCQYVPPTASSFQLELVFQTDHNLYPIDQRCAVYVGDMDGDGVPEVVSKGTAANQLFVFSGVDGSHKQTFSSPANSPFSQVALGDVDRDGLGDVFIVNNSANIMRFEFGTAAAAWTSSAATHHSYDTPQLADFDYDGTPEVYSGARIFNAIDGTRLATGSGSIGQYGSNADKFSMAYDVFQNGDPKPGGGNFGAEADGLELVAGNNVYTYEPGNGSQDNGTLTVVSSISGGLNDGFTSMADIDGDGAVDIAVMSAGSIYVWNPRTETQIGTTYNIPGTSGGGRINIGDFDNDGMVELGTAGLNIYVVLEYNSGTNSLDLKWSKTGLDDGSQRTGSTLFDFEGDGNNEIVYSEEEYLYILKASDGTELTKVQSQSGTRTDYPLVADVNNDGASEIILTSQNGNGPGFSGAGYIRVYRSANLPWMPARKVWNQSGFISTNVNEDLTIPKQQQNPLHASFNGAMNGFLVQMTEMTATGSPTYKAADAVLTIDGTSFPECDSLQINYTVANNGLAELPGSLPVSIYLGDPQNDNPTLHETIPTGTSIAGMGSASLSLKTDISSLSVPFDVYIVVNDNGSLSGSLPYDLATDFPITGTGECDFTNNIGSATGLTNQGGEICNNGIDDDCDGRIDCDDPDCYSKTVCSTCPTPGGQILKPGYMAITCRPVLGNITLAVEDMTGLGAHYDAGNFGLNWQSINMVRGWTNTEFGGDEVMGLAIDQRAGIIYAANTRIWNATPSQPKIYKIDRLTGDISTFATLPGSSLGVGYIDIDTTHNQMFASNYDDGKIYRIDLHTGDILSTFDYGSTGTVNGSATPRAEMVVGVAYNPVDNRLYYSLYGNANNSNMRSIGLDMSGDFDTPTDQEEFVIGHSYPVGDIEFNAAGNRMLLSEIQLNTAGTATGSHAVHQMEYGQCQTGDWVEDLSVVQGNGTKYASGFYAGGPNARGGIAWAYHHVTNDTLYGFEEYVVFTSDALNFPSPYIYGMQYSSSAGGNAGNSVLVDLDNDVGSTDKNYYGEIDIYHGGCGQVGASTSPYGLASCPQEICNDLIDNDGDGDIDCADSDCIPGDPGALTGAADPCEGDPNNYSISAVSGAASYNWTVPVGSSINSGQGTTSISVTFGGNNGDVCVEALNDTGNCASTDTCTTVTIRSILGPIDNIIRN